MSTGAHVGTWRSPPRTDLLLAALFCVLVTVEIVTVLTWRSGGLLLPAMAALGWRRVSPVAVAAVVMAVVTLVDVDGQTTGILAVALVTYTLGSALPPRRAVTSMLVLGGVVLLAGQFRDAFVNPSDVAAMFIFWVGPFLVGMGHRDATEKAARARLHAALADELRVRDTREAVARERSRIARELHDVVSHSLTVVTINAQAVRRSLPPDRAREIDALSAIETTARDAGVEMRRLLGVLRADEEDHALEPQPGLGDLPALAARLSGAGIRVEVDVSASAEHVATGLGVSIYRIVQEALTNVVRHADATRAWVRVTGEGADLLVEIEDDGVGDRRGSAVGGHGLVGITERAHVYGGTAQFGAGERGFLVRVRVPMVRVSA